MTLRFQLPYEFVIVNKTCFFQSLQSSTLHGVDLSVGPRQLIAVIGPVGAGKVRATLDTYTGLYVT